MCYKMFLCDLLYRFRKVFGWLIIIGALIDLGLTCFLVYQLFGIDLSACCTDNKTLQNQCSFGDIGGANNVAVNATGYCQRIDTGLNCRGDLWNCANGLGYQSYFSFYFWGFVPSCVVFRNCDTTIFAIAIFRNIQKNF